jgi:hypothetical protein
VSFDDEGYDEHGVPVLFESTCEAIAEAGTVHAVASAYEPILQKIFDRIEGKRRSVLSSKKGLSEFVGSRGVSLSTIKEQKQWISVQLLSNSVMVYIPSLEKNPSIDPLYDAHIMIPHVASLTDLLDNFKVVCRSSMKPGKFLQGINPE